MFAVGVGDGEGVGDPDAIGDGEETGPGIAAVLCAQPPAPTIAATTIANIDTAIER